MTAEFSKIPKNRKVNILSSYSNQYTGGGDIALIDFIRGGDDFRNEKADYIISATLSEAVVPNSFPIWRIQYYTPEKRLTFRINANNGNIYQTIHGV